MAQQDTNQLMQQDTTTTPADPLAGTTSALEAAQQPAPNTTQTAAPPPPEPPPPPGSQEIGGVQVPTATAFQNAFQVPTEMSQVTPEQTVAGQIEKITAKESPLSLMAKTQAQQAAQQRGLGQSTLAIEAGQKALYEAALPIAQADAATAANRANMLLQGYMQAGQSAQDATQQSQLLIQEAVARGQLSQQEAQQALEHIQVAGQIAQDQSRLDAQLTQDTQEYLKRLDAELSQTGIDQQRKDALFGNYSTSIQNLVANRSNMISQIQSAPGYTFAEKTALIRQVDTQFNEDLGNMNEIYSSSPVWDDSWALFGAGDVMIEGSAQGAFTTADQQAADAAASIGLTDLQYAGYRENETSALAFANNIAQISPDRNRESWNRNIAGVWTQMQAVLENYGPDAYNALRTKVQEASGQPLALNPTWYNQALQNYQANRG